MAAVIAGWRNYWKVYEKYAADPENSDLNETQHVTTGEEATLILRRIDTLREQGMRSEGGFAFRNIEVALGGMKEVPRTAVLSYCLDRSGLNLFDIETGEPVPTEGAFLERVTMQLMPDGTWRVATSRNEKSAC